ncbi:MAG: hypothetical protein JO165_00275 [Candidatus Eremiobacteraeota bacterium]|nr:hypothetical protein [Candidatus Eremiobacteraeota bacterium]
MVQRLRTINPLQLAIVLAILYALLSLIIAIPAMLISMGTASMMPQNPLQPIFAGPLILIVLPIFYGAVGFIAGLITAALYNLVARWTGGIEVTLEPTTTVLT